MAGRLNIQWRSNFFVTLRILQLLLVIILVVPKPGSYYYGYGLPSNKRSPIPEPRRGGSSYSYDSSSSDGSYGETHAQYVTPYMAISYVALTIVWCITALVKYFRHTLRPKVSMGWDTVFSIFWLSLIICNAIGMSETNAWAYPPYQSLTQYTIFVISVIIFLVFIWSYLNGGRAHRKLGSGNHVPADNEPTQVGILLPVPEQAGSNPLQYNPPQQFGTPYPQQYNIPQRFSTPQPYNAHEQQFAPVPYPQRYSTHSPQPVPQYAGSHYAPPTTGPQYGTPPTQQYYQPPVWHNGQTPPQ